MQRVSAALLLTLAAAPLRAADINYVPYGQTVTINELGVCRKITNNSPTGQEIMVPAGSHAEWDSGGQSFIKHPPSGVTLATCQCSLPWGGVIDQGANVTAYAASHVPYGSSCQGESRLCNNGALSGTYLYQNCTVDPCVRDGSQAGWYTIANGCNDDLYDNCGILVSFSDNGSCGGGPLT